MPVSNRARRLVVGTCIPEQTTWSPTQVVVVVVTVVIATITLVGLMDVAGISVRDVTNLLGAAFAVAAIARRLGQ
ncbi:hypothetical protein [Streptomyces sp. NPDC059122]|uniref:hypothetical protein n=1 Tax=Streptomyces sp. NPDC059122 TaxID=3346732 RepID=UPI0036A9828A